MVGLYYYPKQLVLGYIFSSSDLEGLCTPISTRIHDLQSMNNTLHVPETLREYAMLCHVHVVKISFAFSLSTLSFLLSIVCEHTYWHIISQLPSPGK